MKITKKQLLGRIALLGNLTEEQQKRVVCAIIGHSNIQTTCFGYVYCGRCGDQVGDYIASCYENDKQVVVGHGCDLCKTNYKKLTWKDKLFAPTKKEIFKL